MEEKMKLLIGLQACDARIRDVKGRMEAMPLRIQDLEGRLKILEEQLKQETEALEMKRRERRRADQEIEVFDGRIEKSNVKLSNIKSNKEYRAALKEIDDLKFEKLNLEERAIATMEELEGLDERCRAGKAQIEEMRGKFDSEKADILKELEALGQKLEDLMKDRQRLCVAIDADLLKQYSFLMEKRKGLAISPVIKGICQSCHMGIPPQKFNELIRGDALMTCPNCKRIIYWGDKESFREVVQA